jgi:Domain of unknown function (DUF4936)
LNLYIYFRTAARDRRAVEGLIHGLIAERALRTGIHGELLLRSEPKQHELTWMEIYCKVPADQIEDFLEQMSVDIKRVGLDRLIAGERHVERFEPAPGSDAAASRAGH